jgi:transmembrane sensor
MDKNNDFIKDWLEGKISPDELKSKRKSEDELVKEFDELITRSSHLKMPESISKDQAWKNFTARVSETTTHKKAKVVKMDRWIPLSIAASVSLLIVAFFAFSKTEVATQFAETKVHVLPDGSEVTLNADSKIAFRKVVWSSNRVVSLEGEAFFNVKKGSSFVVETEQGTVTVLGTSFNVNTRSNGFEVACFTGKVNVAVDDKSVMLTKGLETKLMKGKLTEAQSFDDQQTTWRDGDFHFASQPLSVVFDELERQFNIKIIFSGDSTKRYSGKFSNKDLNEALEIVLQSMQLTHHREGNRIIVK